MKINSILSTKGREVVTIHPEQSIRDAVGLLSHHKIGALVVVDAEERLVGILSERDIIQHAAVDENVFSLAVAAVMTRKVVTGVPQDDLFSVVHTMTERRFRHLPIMDNDRLVGIISIGDVLKAQRDQYRGEIDTLETQILAGEA
jgi:CBS domain-containing protein